MVGKRGTLECQDLLDVQQTMQFSKDRSAKCLHAILQEQDFGV
jgi:hypothetical protein